MMIRAHLRRALANELVRCQQSFTRISSALSYVSARVMPPGVEACGCYCFHGWSVSENRTYCPRCGETGPGQQPVRADAIRLDKARR